MVRTGIIATLVAVLAVGAAPAQAESGWITDGDGFLYKLNTATGLATIVGSMSTSISALAGDGSSTLLGIEEGPGQEQHLVSLDVATAATDERGLMDASDLWVSLTVTSDGTMYTASAGTTPHASIYEVDPADGSMAPVGDAQSDSHFAALAGGCGNTLVAADQSNHLVSVDRATGVPTIFGALPAGGDPVVALAFDHQHGTLWAMSRSSAGDEHLFQVDPTAGGTTATTYLPGQIGSGPIGLAFDSPSACRYQRKLSLAYSAKARKFTGRLTSGGWQPCAASQKVSVFRKVTGPDDKLGTVRTSATGHFSLDKRLTRGSAYAVAPKSSKPSTGVCLGASSGLVR